MNTESPLPMPTLDYFEAQVDRLIDEEQQRARNGRRTLRGLLAAGTVAAVVVTLVVLASPAGNQPLALTPAEATLQDLASSVDEEGTDLTLADDQLLYQRKFSSGGTIGAGPGGIGQAIDPGTYFERTTEQWISSEGDIWATSSANDSSSEKTRDSSVSGFFEGLTYDEVLSLPRDPEALYERVQAIAAENGDSSSASLLGTFGSLLEQPLPADLQSSLVEATARIPGATLVEAVTPPMGSPVTAISYEIDKNIQWELLFDPSTGQYRGWTYVLNGERYYNSLILERGVVESRNGQPDGASSGG